MFLKLFKSNGSSADMQVANVHEVRAFDFEPRNVMGNNLGAVTLHWRAGESTKAKLPRRIRSAREGSDGG